MDNTVKEDERIFESNIFIHNQSEYGIKKTNLKSLFLNQIKPNSEVIIKINYGNPIYFV